MADTKEVLNSSLILMGEIGGNDYNHPFFQGINADEVRTFVPSVVGAISSAINVRVLPLTFWKFSIHFGHNVVLLLKHCQLEL